MANQLEQIDASQEVLLAGAIHEDTFLWDPVGKNATLQRALAEVAHHEPAIRLHLLWYTSSTSAEGVDVARTHLCRLSSQGIAPSKTRELSPVHIADCSKAPEKQHEGRSLRGCESKDPHAEVGLARRLPDDEGHARALC